MHQVHIRHRFRNGAGRFLPWYSVPSALCLLVLRFRHPALWRPIPRSRSAALSRKTMWSVLQEEQAMVKICSKPLV